LTPTVELSLSHETLVGEGLTYLIAYIARKNPLKYSSLTGKTIGLRSLDPWILSPPASGNENIASKIVPGTSKQFLGTRKIVFSTYSSLHNPNLQLIKYPYLEDDNAEVIFCVSLSRGVLIWTTVGFIVGSGSIIHTLFGPVSV